MRLIAEITGLATRQLELPEGFIRGLYVRYNGTATTSYTGEEVGDLRVLRKGKTIVNVNLGRLQNANNFRYGTVEEDETSGAWIHSCYVPFFVPQIPNALHVKGGEQTLLVCPQAGSDALTQTIRVYADMCLTPEIYEPHIGEIALTQGSSVKTREPIGESNVAWTMVSPGSTNPTWIEIYKDGEVKVNGSWTAAQGATNVWGRLESSTLLNVLFADMVESGNLGESLGDQVEVLTLDGVGTAYATYFALAFDKDRRYISTQAVARVIANKMRLKSARGEELPFYPSRTKVAPTRRRRVFPPYTR
jgi:hypothetical protein